MKQILKLIRVHHWVKNLAIFLPVFFSGRLLEVLFDHSIYKAIILFFAFSLTSSLIYILNDALDVEKDRLHPEKKNRPLASGYFSIKQAVAIALFLFVLSVSLIYSLDDSKWFVIGYFVLNVLYAFILKNIAIIDVICISIGFLIRILAGGLILGIVVSKWMIIIVFLLSMSIGFAKRRDDLTIQNGVTLRKSQSGYTTAFIDIAKSICFSVTLMAYILYTISEEVIARVGTDKLYITSLPVFIGIMRYLQISLVENKSGSPIKILSRDVFLQATLLVWLMLFAYFIYFQK
ncbi:hypothetical protein DN53_14570 [Flagellimonas olearia]|uniref:Decaprenyl-phosphate phosphoribosyltransferase n=1 Tax=Flagellimonas olearia TaxID=552546 RepID=A0A444VKW0_9FLAO|nr:hypothetical protein DN53_14570 [Allomuricauda olearia]